MRCRRERPYGRQREGRERESVLRREMEEHGGEESG